MPADTLTPTIIAQRYRVNVHKILSWIKAGELRAVNVAGTRGGRPRWRITVEALAAFEASRSNSTPPPAPVRQRPKPPHVIEFV